jgi:hypothetical protein
MTRKPFVLSISLLAFFCVGVLRSDIAEAQRRSRGDNPQTGTAVSREASPPPIAAAPASAPVAARAAEEGAQQAQPRNGGRNRGANPQAGTAVPRQAVPGARGGTVFVGPPVRSYYYNPYRYYPYGYGAFGLGYFYYDPYLWYPPAYGYYGGYGGYGYYEPVGEVRIAVKPNFGSVNVDGYYAGRVDDYDGVFQALKLEPGAHHIQVTAPGYAPLDFDVRVDPGRKVTYRGAMIPAHQ